jgi:hypothetical protein
MKTKPQTVGVCEPPKKVTMGIDAFMAPYERRNERERVLLKERATLRRYLRMKYWSEDWHGVQDAASDLRDIDSELDGLRY